ncbi:MAG: phage tail sheath C-terminal domain-containing protein [Verrucomicrobiota bacterium]
MPEYRHPGVYVEEIPSGVRPIEGVPTSITAFIGRAQRGPLNSPTTLHSFNDFIRRFGSFWKDSELPSALHSYFDNGGSEAIVVRIDNSATAAAFEISTDPNTPVLKLLAANPGKWAEHLRLTITHPSDQTERFNLEVVDLESSQTESFRLLSTDPAEANFIGSTLRESSELLRLAQINGQWQCPSQRPPEITAHAPLPGTASDGKPLTKSDFISPQSQQNQKGLYALEKTESFNLLCIPPYLPKLEVDPSLTQAAIALCERKRAIHLIDPPASWSSTTKVLRNQNQLGSQSGNASVFYPRIRRPDPLSPQQTREFAPSASIAGLIARTDSTRGVWKAPAGIEANIRDASGLSENLANYDLSRLNARAVNCLRMIGNAGPLVWGARTLAGRNAISSHWKYLSVRRLALFIEESMERGLRWVVFEPNDEPLWAQIRLNANAFMNNLFRKGAFRGQKRSEAYFVKCDNETTTPSDIQNGIANLHIGFAPLKPAEFIIVNLALKTQT